MSMIRFCDVCKRELEYGIGEKVRGLIWGEYHPAENGKRPFIAYIEKEGDIKLDDVCPKCMDEIMEKIKEITIKNESDMLKEYKGGSK